MTTDAGYFTADEEQMSLEKADVALLSKERGQLQVMQNLKPKFFLEPPTPPLMVQQSPSRVSLTKSETGSEQGSTHTTTATTISNLIPNRKVSWISLHVHGFVQSNKYLNSELFSSNSLHSNGFTRSPAFYPGDVINGSVQLHFKTTKIGPTQKSAADLQDVPKVTIQINDGSVQSLNSVSEGDLESSKFSSVWHHSVNAATSLFTDCENGSESFVVVSLRGYVKTRVGGNYFKIQEEYLNETKEILIPSALSTDKPNVFMFDFRLPEDLPPSFKGKNAVISYRLRARFKKCLRETKLPIEIRYNAELDENTPIGCDNDLSRKQFGFCCFSQGNRSVWAKIERSIFQYQGDAVLINAKFHNLRHKAAQPVVKLIQRQTSILNWIGSSKVVKKYLTEWELNVDGDTSPILPFTDRVWENVICTFPTVVPSFECSALKVDYIIQVGLEEKSSIYENPVASMAITMACSWSTPNDGIHLYVSGRKHRKIPINKLGQLATSPSAHSHLSAITEGRESMTESYERSRSRLFDPDDDSD